jgi:uncharacterized membrane protein YhhN
VVNTTAWVLLGVAAVFAVGDWLAVARGAKPAEYLCKPAATAALVGVAVALDPVHGDTRAWFVAALVLSLAGDAFLMLPRDRFVPGLGSFLLAQLAFAVGFALHTGSATEIAVGVVIVVVAATVLGRRFVHALVVRGDRALVGPVVAYMVAIAAMVASAVAGANAWGIAGASSFFASDALIAETRFVSERRWGPVAIMVTYHLALAGLVVSLV